MYIALQRNLNLTEEEMQQLLESAGRTPSDLSSQMLNLEWSIDNKTKAAVHISLHLKLTEEDFAMIVGQVRRKIDLYLTAKEKAEARMETPPPSPLEKLPG